MLNHKARIIDRYPDLAPFCFVDKRAYLNRSWRKRFEVIQKECNSQARIDNVFNNQNIPILYVKLGFLGDSDGPGGCCVGTVTCQTDEVYLDGDGKRVRSARKMKAPFRTPMAISSFPA
jgi:hypothetical protein